MKNHTINKFMKQARLVIVLGSLLIGLGTIHHIKAAPPKPPVSIRTRLQPYQIPDVKPANKDGRLLKEAPSSIEEQQATMTGLAQQTFLATADATVMQGYASQDFGDTIDMWAGYDDLLNPDGKIVRSLVKFNIASLPANQVVTKATLRVHLVETWDFPNTSRMITTYRITGSWLENGVNWNNKPGFGQSYGSKSIRNDDFTWHEFDVTNLVKDWYNDTFTNHGIMLRGPEISGANSSWRSFSTREGSFRPELIIEYAASTPPALTSLPDQTLPANTSLDNVIDLWAYASDAESPDSDLTFTITNSSSAKAGVTIDNNQYIDLNPVIEWAGTTFVFVRVTDPDGLSDTDIFRVTVTNSAPVFTDLPDQTLTANTSLDNAIDLWEYANDAESSDDKLTFAIDNVPATEAGISIDSNRYLDLNPVLDWVGQTEVVIRVVDFDDLFSTSTFSVEVQAQISIFMPLILK